MASIEDLMKDRNAQMTDDFLASALGDSLPAWLAFNDMIAECGLSLEWRFYKDGGWLAKITHKKKTVIWSSVSERFFSASFLFSNKPHLLDGVRELDISDELKEKIEFTPTGSYFSTVAEVSDVSQLADVRKLTEFKMGAK